MLIRAFQQSWIVATKNAWYGFLRTSSHVIKILIESEFLIALSYFAFEGHTIERRCICIVHNITCKKKVVTCWTICVIFSAIASTRSTEKLSTILFVMLYWFDGNSIADRTFILV